MQWSEKLSKQTALTCPKTATKYNIIEQIFTGGNSYPTHTGLEKSMYFPQQHVNQSRYLVKRKTISKWMTKIYQCMFWPFWPPVSIKQKDGFKWIKRCTKLLGLLLQHLLAIYIGLKKGKCFFCFASVTASRNG